MPRWGCCPTSSRAPTRWKLHELGALAGSLQHAEDLLALRYWSQTAYRLGPHVVKYSAAAGRVRAGRGRRGAARLTSFASALASRLGSQDQRRSSSSCSGGRIAASMPIEDADREWDGGGAPFVRVATITIPRAALRLAGPDGHWPSRLSFTPWHTLPDARTARRHQRDTPRRLRSGVGGAPRAERHAAGRAGFAGSRCVPARNRHRRRASCRSGRREA